MIDVVRNLRLAIALVLLCTAASTLAQETDSKIERDDSTVTYPSAYFQQFAPVSVNDMLIQIPGIDRVLDADLGKRMNPDESLTAEWDDFEIDIYNFNIFIYYIKYINWRLL